MIMLTLYDSSHELLVLCNSDSVKSFITQI